MKKTPKKAAPKKKTPAVKKKTKTAKKVASRKVKPKSARKVVKKKTKAVKKSVMRTKKMPQNKKPLKKVKPAAKKPARVVVKKTKVLKKKVLPAKKTAPEKTKKSAAKKPPAVKETLLPSKKEVKVEKELRIPAPLPSMVPLPTDAEMDKDVVLLTEEGLKALKEELEELKTVRRKEVAKRLKEAISYGDLSENSEYEEAKNEQAFVEGRILDLEKKIKHAKIIAGERASVVRIGSTVSIVAAGHKKTAEYTIVGSTEADPMAQRISNESPVGKALLGRKKGEKVFVEAPGGKFEYEILGIK